MKIALVAITKHGVQHALELRKSIPEAELFFSEKQKGEGQEGASYFATIKEMGIQQWNRQDGFVFFVSLGAVVRTIAPLLKSKDEDPAVVTVDDGKRFAISLLSGHVGGANELAERVATGLNCQAVITTASEARATVSVDILGRELGWTIESKAHVTPVSAAMVNEKPVAFIQECGEKNWWTRPNPLPKNIQIFSDIAKARSAGDFDANLLVSDRATVILEAELGPAAAKTVIYRPKTLSCGMGCDFGADVEELRDLVDATFAEAGLSTRCIRRLASIDIKEKEEALHQLAGLLGVGIDFYTRDELNERKTKTMPNPLVMKYTGAIGVCEPSAMLSAGVGDLVVMKHKAQKSTLAVARKEF